MKRRLLLPFLAAPLAALLTGGCVFGEEGRELDLTTDMMAGDLAFYRNRLPDDAGGEVLGHYVTFPLLIVPVILHAEEGQADLVEEDVYHYHFEEFSALALVVTGQKSVAKFDHDGRNLWWSHEHSLLFGLLYDHEEASRKTDEGRDVTETNSVVLGLFRTKSRNEKSQVRLLWFLTLGDDLD